MRIIIIGAGKIGRALTKLVCNEGHDVIVIDEDGEKIDKITDDYDCNGYVGNGSSPALLEKAGIHSTSLVVAVTKQDETNLLCCSVAKQLGVKRTVAAVRGPEYSLDKTFFREKMGADMLINPDKAAAREVNKLVRYAGSVEIEDFGDGQVKVATVDITSNSVLNEAMMPEVAQKLGASVLICAIKRGGKIITPKGKHQIKAGDQITFAALAGEMDKALQSLNIIQKVIKRTVVVGASKVGYYLAQLLLEQGVKVTLVDNDQKRCEELLETLPGANVVLGDGTDSEFIERELKNADSFVASTGKDEENLIISMFAKSFGMDRIVAEVDNDNYAAMLRKSGIDHIFSTQDAALSGIIKDSRLLTLGEEKSGDAIRHLHTFHSGKIEALEFAVGKEFKLLNTPFKDPKFSLKNGVLVAVIIRGTEAMVPDGNSVLMENDRVIVVSSEAKIAELADIIA